MNHDDVINTVRAWAWSQATFYGWTVDERDAIAGLLLEQMFDWRTWGEA